jgi:UDP-N-acetylmuramate--alanine ligase
MNILEYQSFYLVGIKGVAMSSLAQCLVDAGKKVTGSDVAEEFVTQKILDNLHIQSDNGFEATLPEHVDCVIYTAAHQANQNPQVQQALSKHIPIFSHAEALASLFNQKQGIAVCGVGGKSTTSAMVAWIFEKASQAGKLPQQSFAVGVGNIPGLEKTGQWNPEKVSKYFVAEADEYVTDPSAPSRGEAITPRFSFLNPFITVCTNLHYDHPDVYRDFAHTKEVYGKFFEQIHNKGILIINADDQPLVELAEHVVIKQADLKHTIELFSFGSSDQASLQLLEFSSSQGQTTSVLHDHEKNHQLVLKIPGKFNVMNALAAITACSSAGIAVEDCINALADFRSTMRRSEFVGEKKGVKYYDDYAHHPDEVKQIIQAFKEWYPDQKLVVAFQSHTYSRTKSLLPEFVQAFTQADEVVMTDIFASAREQKDDTISSDILCKEITKAFPHLKAKNLKTNEALAEFCRTDLHEGDILLTVGAGDIYKIHELIS